ncbi:MAG: dTMP kinase [Planctomycetota bacterium]
MQNLPDRIDRDTPPAFLVLDGVDGCGKSTQATRLAEHLRQATGREVEHLREPGTTPVGESLRRLLLDPEVELVPEAEMLLFLAARRTLLHERVAPALAAGRWVVCERFHASTFAYQGVAGGIGGERTLAACLEWAGGPLPAVELILDLPLPLALERRGMVGDRIENQGSEYHLRVAQGYREYLERAPRARAIDANGDADTVARRVWQEVCDVCAG